MVDHGKAVLDHLQQLHGFVVQTANKIELAIGNGFNDSNLQNQCMSEYLEILSKIEKIGYLLDEDSFE